MTSSYTAAKRKRVTLTIEKKLDVLKKIDQGASLAAVALEFGLGKSTVSDIKRGRKKILKFATESTDPSCLKKRLLGKLMMKFLTMLGLLWRGSRAHL